MYVHYSQLITYLSALLVIGKLSEIGLLAMLSRHRQLVKYWQIVWKLRTYL